MFVDLIITPMIKIFVFVSVAVISSFAQDSIHSRVNGERSVQSNYVTVISPEVVDSNESSSYNPFLDEDDSSKSLTILEINLMTRISDYERQIKRLSTTLREKNALISQLRILDIDKNVEQNFLMNQIKELTQEKNKLENELNFFIDRNRRMQNHLNNLVSRLPELPKDEFSFPGIEHEISIESESSYNSGSQLATRLEIEENPAGSSQIPILVNNLRSHAIEIDDHSDGSSE